MISMRIHSVIDVITNSSTEIYSYVDGNGVQATYDMLDAVIKSVGGTQSAKDMFVVTAGPSISDIIDRMSDSDSDEHWVAFMQNYPELLKGWRERDHGEAQYQYNKRYEDLLKNDVLIREFSRLLEDCEGLETNIHITAKDGTDTVAKAVEKFLNCFHAEEYNN